MTLRDRLHVGYLSYLLWIAVLRVRCLGAFHDFDDVDTGDYSGSGMPLWYCRRCWVYERNDEVVTSTPFMRIVWRLLGWRAWYWFYR